MNTALDLETSVVCHEAKRRLVSVKGDPFVFVDWERVVFLHFLIAPESLRPYLPTPFSLELYQGNACVSVVALTMRHFRDCRFSSPAGLLRPIGRQCFLNVRTYVRSGDEPGALFLWGWLSRPFGAPLPSGLFGLPYAFASISYHHDFETGTLEGKVEDLASRSFVYRACIDRAGPFESCAPGTLAEFTMERYTGFFSREEQPWVFRAWHRSWRQKMISATIENDSLLRARFPWFKEATLASATFTPGLEGVWLGQPHRFNSRARPRHHRLSSFFEMP